MQWQWKQTNPDPGSLDRLRGELGCSAVMAAVLANRGMADPSKARRFLDPRLDGLRPPSALRDMDRAVRRLRQALVSGERILVHGDYDVDGVTATALLVDVLREMGARVSWAIPHRVADGYGLKPSFVGSHAVPNGVRLIVTVDCGSSDHEAIETARRAGIDVIVTDHHLPPVPHPRPAAFVNPNRSDCTSGMGHLAGVGVAFYLAAGLRAHLRDEGVSMGPSEPNLKRRCDLVALGTVADMVPLAAENRILVRAGLEELQSGRRPGVRALMDTAGVKAGTVDEADIAFRLGPRLNAAGRMAHASIGLELLLSADLHAARTTAARIEDLNRLRRETEQEVFDQILRRVDRSADPCRPPAFVLSDAQWHEGVLGIAASRLVHRFHRPAVLIRNREPMGRGSARSIPGLDLHALLHECSGHLEGFGGHAAAAGLSIAAENIDAFRTAFEARVRHRLEEVDLQMRLDIDAPLPLAGVTGILLDELETLKPYGQGNPEPVFVAEDVAVLASDVVGERHRRLVLAQSAEHNASPMRITAMQFNTEVETPCPDRFRRVAFRAGWNVWRGVRSPQLVIVDVRNFS